MFNKIYFSLVLLVAFLIIPMGVLAENVKMRVGFVDTPPQPVTRAMMIFSDNVKAKTDSQIIPKIHHSGVLGSDREMLESTQIGSIEMTIAGTGVGAPFIPTLGLWNIPFMFNTYEEAWAVAENSDIKEFMKKEARDAGFVFLGFMDQGFRNITNNKRAIWTLKDLKGLKIRTMEAPSHMINFKALGASPTPMTWGELYTSLQQGVVDGQENPISTPLIYKFYEVQDYLSITQHIYDVLVVLANTKWWDSLKQDQQELIVSELEDGAQFTRELSKELDIDALFKLLAMESFHVNVVPKDEIAKFKALGQPAVMESLYKNIDKDKVDWWVKKVDAITSSMR